MRLEVVHLMLNFPVQETLRGSVEQVGRQNHRAGKKINYINQNFINLLEQDAYINTKRF
jgi:hypothetical protein